LRETPCFQRCLDFPDSPVGEPLAKLAGQENYNMIYTYSAKSETRNSKQIQNSKLKNKKTLFVLGFEFWSFDIVSDFGFLI